MNRFFRRVSSVLLAFACVTASLASPLAARAVTFPLSFDADTTLRLSGLTYDLTILSGSHMDSSTDRITITPTTFTVTMTGTGHLTVRWPGPTPGRFPNDGSVPECTYVNANNDLSVDGPIAVTFTPTHATTCQAPPAGGGSSGASSAGSPPSVSVAVPNGGETFEGGTLADVIWNFGGPVTGTRLSYSTDDGATWTVINAAASGGYEGWTLPMIATTKGRVRAEALISGGSVGATDASDATFTITLPAGVTGTYTTEEVTDGSPSVNEDVGLQDATPPEHPLCEVSSLIKLPSDGDLATTADSSVYYCGKDGKRYVFPSFWIYSTWYPDFSTVKETSPSVMSQIRLGGNVTYRPGVRMVKIQSDPRVYAVAAHGTLRWVTSQEVAERLYGPNWNKAIDDVSDAFMEDYYIGEPIY